MIELGRTLLDIVVDEPPLHVVLRVVRVHDVQIIKEDLRIRYVGEVGDEVEEEVEHAGAPAVGALQLLNAEGEVHPDGLDGHLLHQHFGVVYLVILRNHNLLGLYIHAYVVLGYKYF